MSLLSGFFSLGRNINKFKGDTRETEEGVISDLVPELTLEMEDDDLIDLAKKWQKKWNDSEVKKDFERFGKENEAYWEGKHYTTAEYLAGDRPLADNLIFESLETLLPVVTRQNPEPTVSCDNTPDGEKFAADVRYMLIRLADILRLKLKIKKATRNWALYHLGIAKVGWSEIKNDVTISAIRPHRLILDSDATIEDGEYTGYYIGELKTGSASILVERFPAKKDFILKEVDNKTGSELGYYEWWTDDYIFWSYKEEVLGKYKNPHWNYEEQKGQINPATGIIENVTAPVWNHFEKKKKPYVFLSVFNLGKRPIDDTGLIQQNVALQDMVNKRLRQIDKNADNANGGVVVSGDYFNKEQAKQASEALRKGATLFVPHGDVNAAYKRDNGGTLPTFIYQSLQDYRNEMRGNFGVTGLSPQGTKSEDTVRGKIIVRGQDTDRAAFVVDYIEQFADEIFNWFVQLMCVYYDEEHAAAVVGKERAVEFVILQKSDFVNRKLTVSVKEGSMIPKDALTKRNEAVDLFTAGGLDPISLFERLEFPNPRESAKNLFLWKTNPAMLFPDLRATIVPPISTGGVPPIAPEQSQQSVMPSLAEVPI